MSINGEKPLDITIEEANFRDIPGLESVRERVWRSTYSGIAPDYINDADMDIIFAPDRVKSAVERGQEAVVEADPNRHIQVAKFENEVVGFSIAKKHSENLGEVLSLYVIDEFQGKGIGGALMEGAVNWLQPEQRAIRLEVIETNEKAIAIYHKKGFHFSRKLPLEKPDPPLKYIPHIEMIRPPGLAT